MKVGDMVMYRDGSQLRKAMVVRVVSEDVVDLNIYDSGIILGGKEECQMAKTPQEQSEDGRWFHLPA